MVNKIGIIGAGAFGTALAKIVAEKGIDVTMWSFDKEGCDQINSVHENKKFLPGIKLPENITATTSILEAANDKEIIILASPSLFILDSVKKLLDVPFVKEGKTTIGIVAKGFIPSKDEPKLILETIENYLPGFYRDNLVYISGPSHAEEVATGGFTGLISASKNPKNSIKIRELLSSDSLNVFSSFDVVGVQISAAVKNVIAIAFGVLDAIKERSSAIGDNTESLLLAAGLNEIMSLGKSLGATHAETFTSIAGVGDLDVTCRSIHGRNRRFGRDIILNNILDNFKDYDDLIDNLDKLPYLPEGAVAVGHAYKLAKKHGLKLDIINTVWNILNKNSTPEDEVKKYLKITKF
ncbi:NAD(P)-dependent glycerol-3-phosphate dehydrogenase [Thiospirochaeta perfilievii]|uniref:Glycerol-3-phosphate dehydrogenase [NAD(P)+] n=1 Tax=Thiospirochaeta perfilievii TaxID=252967 RepID=A0A5C1QFY9_9SPIO|nr:NAD(P)H-dependent glycerol-3-phosphate dehydrogenase [Thiospirochaeta perfilievii]QEN06060.1 NAD(P)-dependent glycerol-3-phosphate dehydrogenase [Thiospirochaeta perfilievii]